jgi:hypothetical protein
MPKRKYLVVARNTQTSEHGLQTSKGHIPFHKKTAKMLDDPGLASEIDTEYGLKGTGDVWVERDERMENAVNYHDGVQTGHAIHNFFFGPTRQYADAWERIFGKKE